MNKQASLSEMLREGLFRFVSGNVSLSAEGVLVVTDGRFLAGVTLQEIDELRHKLAGEAAHIKSLEGLLVDAVRERDLIKNHYSAEAAAKLRAELASARAEIERLRGIIQEWSYPRLYIQPGVERETLLAQLQENLANKVRPSIEAAEVRGAKWALERHDNPFDSKTLDQYAQEICRYAREKR